MIVSFVSALCVGALVAAPHWRDLGLSLAFSTALMIALLLMLITNRGGS